jgi:two-component system NtrC family sensor kinase
VRMALVSEGEHASIEIEDDGPGVPASERDKVFELYFTTKGGSGSGMGLPICRKVARDHGGDVVCEAASLGGARFRMCLPLTSAAW